VKLNKDDPRISLFIPYEIMVLLGNTNTAPPGNGP
jgi:hypothetical protein